MSAAVVTRYGRNPQNKREWLRPQPSCQFGTCRASISITWLISGQAALRVLQHTGHRRHGRGLILKVFHAEPGSRSAELLAIPGSLAASGANRNLSGSDEPPGRRRAVKALADHMSSPSRSRQRALCVTTYGSVRVVSRRTPWTGTSSAAGAAAGQSRVNPWLWPEAVTLAPKP
ncbi:hypothetical protein [Streptomyces sp. SA15]|uniref:hypothetical protein n=1 Tax=Streptomyces sp. SA15 TaxID=934019 RepID=UPI0015CDB5E0|nr:hypothetical protein [Streptomyces sp. SA15]